MDVGPTPVQPIRTQTNLAINVDKVESVLLADGWHEVVERSFDLDTYEYVNDSLGLRTGPHITGRTVGATWKERDGVMVACPLSAILAVKWHPGVPQASHEAHVRSRPARQPTGS